MGYYAGLDVAMKRSAMCVIDDSGAIVQEGSVDTDPDAIAAALAPFDRSLQRVGHETGSLAPWLHKTLRARGLPIICMEAAHTRSAEIRAYRPPEPYKGKGVRYQGEYVRRKEAKKK